MEHAGAIYACTYSAKLKSVLTGGADRVVASWNPENLEPNPFTIKTNSAILNLNAIGENVLLVGLFNGHFHLIDMEKRIELKYVTKQSKGIYSSAYHPESDYVATGDGNGTVCIWSKNCESLLMKQKVSEGKIRSIILHQGCFIIGDSEGFLYKIDGKNLDLLEKKQISETGLNALCHFPEKNSFLVGNKDAEMLVLSDETLGERLRFPAHNWPIYKIVMGPEHIYSCSRDKTIKVWSKENLDIIERLSFPKHKGHTHSINNLIYINELSTLISVGDDKAICLWK